MTTVVIGVAVLIVRGLWPAGPAPSMPAAPDGAPLAHTTGSADRAAPADGVPPVRVVIPDIDVDSEVVPVGAPGGALDLPDEPWVVGWWEDGVGTGSDHGATLLAAHLTKVEYGDGPLVRAKDLRPGQEMSLTDASGVRRSYVVTGVDTYVKTRLPYEQLFAQDGSPRVVLVTCGGTYQPQTGHWDSNVVVTFDPVTRSV